MKSLELGQIIGTEGITNLIECGKLTRLDLQVMLTRHISGDWGCCCEEDKASNDAALIEGNRIISSYPIDPLKECAGWGDNTVWIITEYDRRVTTVLLPSEY